MKRNLQGHYETTTTAGEKVQAFVPAPLPPRPPIDWTPQLRGKFDQALLALGRLDSVSTLLPDTSQSSRGWPRCNIFWKTAYGSNRLPAERRVCSSFTQAKMMTLALESNRKNSRKRLPVLARRQWRNAGPME